MSTLQEFDILFRNFFDQGTYFLPPTQTKFPHPLDIYSNKDGLFFEIACTGLEKSDVELNTEGDILRITYNKPEGDNCCDVNDCEYIHRGIARRSFNLGYRISSKLDITKTDAEMKNGLLKIFIPYSEASKPKVLKIK
jgi:HSP20 family molecular chaperone IbpA